MVDFDTYCKPRKNPTRDDKWMLYNEVDGICPLCGSSLLDSKKGTRLTCQIAHILPCNPTETEKTILADVPVAGENSEDLDNKIALCTNCHQNYDYRKTKEEYIKLYNIKQNFIKETDAKILLSKQPIEDELKNVITKISSINMDLLDSMVSLSLNALEIRQKIPNDQVLLIKKIENNVSTYYLKIRELFKDQVYPQNSFEVISLNIKHTYTLLKSMEQNEEKIYQEIVKWIQSKADCSLEASSILVSFFVQNCEIYDKLSK